MKTVLVLGSGAREHALAWKLAASPQVSRVIVAPGNDGMPTQWERWDFSGLSADFSKLAERARAEKVDLTVVGPDAYLADGIVDVFTQLGLCVFGPTQAAAQLEASKAFAKGVMAAAGIPTASYQEFLDEASARTYIELLKGPFVIKADGLALGKGVVVCDSIAEGLEALPRLFAVNGRQKGRVIIEEKVSGEESSWMAICDGEHCAVLEPARDYKTLREGGRGPNTGGMGAFSPVTSYGPEFQERVLREVFQPTLKEMKRRGTPFRGVLYAGLMISGLKYWVLEFNARFGDPEAQVLLPRIDENLEDFYDLCLLSAQGKMKSDRAVKMKSEHAVYVVAAAPGYPENPVKGARFICKVRESAVPEYFFAGVRKTEKPDEFEVSGGRVFGALGMAKGVGDVCAANAASTARSLAYDRLRRVSFEGMQIRSDVGSGQPIPIAVLASGRGSNFEAILRAITLNRLNARVVAVVSDRAQAPVLEKARASGIPAIHVPALKEISREAHDEAILRALKESALEAPVFLVLAGYMRIVTPKLIEAFRSERGYSRVVNIHPSLLPSFRGLNGYAQAFEHGCQVTGATVHLVEVELDDGPICAQAAFSIGDCRSSEEVEKMGLDVEHRLFPEALSWILPEQFEITFEGRARVRPN